MKSPAIKVREVVKTYEEGGNAVPVLKGISLEVEAGELVAIMGPSGSGKSTLMNLIGLLDRPTQGKLWLSGEAAHLSLSDRRLAELRAAKIGFVFQSFNLLPRLTALANVLMPAQYLRQPDRKARAIQLLTDLGLGHRIHHVPTKLSGGEKQRVAIARALINDPDIILADEPTGNLDSKSGEDVMAILADLKKAGKTVLIVTHDQRVAKRCDRIINILDGVVKGDHA
ncbi:MAG TPA: ABC transporter ATP-binding protein [Verrucomicrobiae bacterium]|nr:ABC transporter ATP-binding protein [Verrucomicrobiae bacterium]